MKAIIPVAGAGTKLRPHTYTQPKALIPLAGKTILSIIVDQLLEAGINEFIFIVGYLGTKIQDYVNDKYPGLNMRFVFQNERQGIGHAILLTRDLVGDDEIFIVLGDTICEYEIRPVVERDVSTLGVKRVDDPRNFGVAEIEEDGFISRVVEKPQIPKSNMALVGFYYIRETAKLMEALDYIIKNDLRNTNEFYLTDAIMKMIKDGVKFKGGKVDSWY
ncbi:MAG: nucleotidyltransferase family protein, partial [Bacteroidota bacterium]|nr:nucleotidyltransferase family protein [Bacteroidota bacterium]